MESIELKPAYFWICNSCGRDNFHRGIAPCMSEEQYESLREQLGIDPDAEGVWVMRPEKVVCTSCGVVYQVEKLS